MSPQDNRGILKLIEFDARQANHRILTTQEDNVARTRISELNTRVRDLQQEIIDISGSLERLHAAIAPYKRLPPEILAEIFMLTLPEDGRRLIPEYSEDTPWTLLSVCSHWRALVLGLPALWGTIHLVESHLHRDIADDSILTIDLPPAGPLFITMSSHSEKSTIPMLEKFIVPNLSRLHALHLHIPSAMVVPTLLNLDAAEIRHLSSVTLDFKMHEAAPLGPKHPSLLPFFRKLVNLRSLKLKFDSLVESPCSLLLSDLLDAEFPSGITDLDLSEHNAIEVGDIERILQRFPRLQTFAGGVYWLNPKVRVPTYLPRLRSLALQGHYPRRFGYPKRCLIDADPAVLRRPAPLNIAWNMLHHLDAGDV
ncbi:hypothetical protein DXG03_004113, partial [Asterophora parasitica]